jgi:hypothetical protein
MSLAQKLARLADIFGGNQSGYGIPFSNRNYMIDGNFDSFITSAYSVGAAGFVRNVSTMLESYTGAGGAATIQQGVFAPGADVAGMTSPVSNYLIHQQTTASTGTVATGNTCGMWQSLESVKTLQGRSATFSCWLWSGTGSTITIPFIIARQNFGTGGSPSANAVFDKTVNWVVTPIAQKFSVRLDIPSISGKTLGTANNDLLQIGLWLPPGVVFTLCTAQWQLEQSSPNSSSDINGNGGDPTAFEYRGPQAELARTQRYYSVTAPYGVFAAGATSQNWGPYSPYPVPMRAQPALTMLFNNSSGQSPPGTYGFTQSTIYGYALVVASGGTGWFNVAGVAAADARL